MGLENRYECHDPDKVIFNYSSYKLSDLEKRLLAKGLNYALPPIKLNYGDYMTPFELFYREIRKLPIEDHELEKLKTEIKKEAYSSFDNYNFWNELNINKEEYLALKGLSSNKNIILQKADKGNSVVLVNKADYIKRMKELLSDVSKFKDYCFYIEVLQLCLIFPNFILKLKHSRKHFTKMLIQQTLLTNVYLNLLTTYLFKNLLLPPFQNWNLE